MVWQGKHRALHDFPSERQLAYALFGFGFFLFVLGWARLLLRHGNLAEVGALNVVTGFVLILAAIPSWQRR